MDIGSHFGESIYKALNPELGFDQIIAYEPSKRAIERVSYIRDPRLVLKNTALGAKNDSIDPYSSGALGASVFKDKRGLVTNEIERINIRNASDELREILENGDEIFVKINCEGGELDILEDLMKSNLILKINHLYVDWDARKIPSLAAQYISTRSKIERLNIDLVSSDSLALSGWKGVEIWLSNYKVKRVTAISKLRYNTYDFLAPKHRLKEIIKNKMPRVMNITRDITSLLKKL